MSSKLHVEELQKWLNSLISDIQDAKQVISVKQQEMLIMEERLKLVSKLIEIETGDVKSDALGLDKQGDIVKECINILRSSGKPLHIKELHKKLLQNGVPLPGKGNEANVIARIQRSDGKIIRVGRGIYGIPEFGLKEKKPSLTKKR